MIEVGEYIRTIFGIAKLLKKEGDLYYFDDLNNELWSGDLEGVVFSCDIEEIVLKHSKNIIDLIEVGDYVNESMVYEKLEDGRVHIMRGSLLNNEDIKTILTKEQYNQNCYKLED